MRISSVTPKERPTCPTKYYFYKVDLDWLWRSIINNGGEVSSEAGLFQPYKWTVTWPEDGDKGGEG